MSARTEVLRLRITGEQDVFLARQRGREVAALAGLENQDQVRVATALSELCRELAVLRGAATVSLALTGTPAPALSVEADWTGMLPGATEHRRLAELEGIRAAARLTDTCTVTWRADGGSVALTKRLPPAAPVDAAAVARMQAAIRRSRPADALSMLRSQNQDLVQALESLQARQDDLLRANAELEETNRGVLALHGELFDELEQTNRGVVALYAELDEATTRLQEASESKTRFWANVSHELRTPLNSVLGLSRLLLDPGSDPLAPEQRYQIELIRDSGAMLLGLVNELLDVSKAESGRIEAHLEPTDLRALFEQLRSSLRPVTDNGAVELVVEEPADDVALLWTDPVLLGRILRNLLSNGLKFTEHGSVRCRARADETTGTLEVEVRDTGIGIPLEHQRRVFEEFHQVPGPLQAAAAGTGLGLPYARRLAEILGGSLDLTSEPGRGTTVVLALPLQRAAPSPPRFGSVLVVDDDPAFRAVLRHALAATAERVTEAGDGPEALRALGSERPDLVLLDLVIPAPDGTAVLAEMRASAALRDVPVVVVTSTTLDSAQRHHLGETAALLDKANVSPELIGAAADTAARLVQGSR